MGRVAGQENAAGAVPLGQTVTDPEHRGPAQRGGGGRHRSRPVQDPLNVLQAGRAAGEEPVRDAVARSGAVAQLPVGQRGDAVAALPGQRDTDHDVVHRSIAGLRRAHAIPDREVPVDFDVAEHVAFGERVAGELDPDRSAHGAVRPVAPDQVPRLDLHCLAVGVAQGGPHPVGILFGALEFDSAGHDGAVRGEHLGQDPFGLVLRQCYELVVQFGGRERSRRLTRAPSRYSSWPRRTVAASSAGRATRRRPTAPTSAAECRPPWRTAGVDQPVDDQDVDAAAAQLQNGGQPDRSAHLVSGHGLPFPFAV